jgi:penicillin G amidase
VNRREREALDRELFANVSTFDAVLARICRQAVALGLVSVAAALAYAGGVAAGWRGAAATRGTISASTLNARASIRRDARDIPHVLASSQNDMFFAQGFAEGSDRLFQMELTRRYALGRLAEVLGAKALPIDESQRYYDVRDIAQRQWEQLAPSERAGLEAFSAGISTAMRTQPLPVEFRLLLYRPDPWTPQDSLAVSLAVTIALGDSWRDVLARNATWRRVGPQRFEQYFPLSDPAYDVTLEGKPVPSYGHALPRFQNELPPVALATSPPRAGSNAWAAGAARTSTGRALLANDPHLDLTIPGLWYVLDLQAPGFHAAGASIPGVPGILLGHNARIAWAATNGDAASMSLYETAAPVRSSWVRELFHVRFARPVTKVYYRTAREFGVPAEGLPFGLALVRWPPYERQPTAFTSFLALDRARDVGEAMRALAGYAGTAENFVVADTGGSVSYHFAGSVGNDGAWGRYVHGPRDLRSEYAIVPFHRLPGVAASRDTVIVTANNKMYGSGYAYRLAPFFDPPYRAYRIAALLRARDRYDAAYFTRMQLDTVSPVDLEFARWVDGFARKDIGALPPGVASDLIAWNGAFSGDSRAATVEHTLRTALEGQAPSLYALLQQLRSGTQSPYFAEDIRGMLFATAGAPQAWGPAGSVHIEHPLAPLRFGFLDGATLPGNGDEYTVHLQESGFAQSFRAVWDVGNWDAGGIVIPSGESGEPGSGHYTDLTATWISGRMEPLPFTDRAVEAATRNVLILEPPR